MIEENSNNSIILSYSYLAFGLRIESQIMLPELPRIIGEPADVRINYGDGPNKVEDPIEETYYYQVASDEFLLRVDGVATFYVAKGNQT